MSDISGKIKSSISDSAKSVASKIFSVVDDECLYSDANFDYVSKFTNKELCIVGIAADNGACGHYRIKLPLLQMEQLGAEVRIFLVESLEELNLKSLYGATHIVMSRCHDRDMFKAIKSYCSRQNIVLVYDLDDCFHEVCSNSPAHTFFNTQTEFGKKNILNMEKNIKDSDGVFFSTRELKGYYENLDPYSHILHNGLDLSLDPEKWTNNDTELWRDLATQQGCLVFPETVVIGWSGSITHIEDLELIKKPIQEVVNKNPNVLLAMYCDPELAMHVCLTRWHMPTNKFFLIPPTSFKKYPSKLAYFDIGIAPLVNNAFNRCKSDLKLIEMGAMGVPYVASKVAPYYRFHLQSKQVGGFMANSSDEWIASLNYLIEKSEERKLRGATIKKYVYKKRDISNTTSSFIYNLRTLSENRFSVTKAPDSTMMEDIAIGVPYPQKKYEDFDPCPCGSGHPYGNCYRQCKPAWGF